MAVNDPSAKSNEVKALEAILRLPQALIGGTTAMRTAGETFLPKEEAEKTKDYNSRVARSFLFGGFERTIDILTGEVFDKPMTLLEETPEEFTTLKDNIDLQGRNLTRFTRGLFLKALYNGVGLILVETPPLPVGDDGNPTTTTAAEDKKIGRRLYWVHIPASQILGARTENINGAMKITQLRVVESVTVPKDEYTDITINQVRVMEPGFWTTYRQYEKEGWVEHDSGTTGIDYIPVSPFHTGTHDSLLDVKPPLMGLAELNQWHWISASDQNNILHFARVPILFGSALNTDDNGSVKISARNLITSDDPAGDLKFVEHSGKAIGDGWKDLERIEMLMSLWGLDLISDHRSGNVTATEKAITGAKTGSFLNSVALDCQDAVNRAIEISCDILKKPFAGGAVVNTEFNMVLGNFDVQTLLQAFKERLLDRVTVIDEFKRRGLVGEDVDPVDVIARLDIDSRSASFGSIGASTLLGT